MICEKSFTAPCVFKSKMVPEAGLEPAQYRYRWILSPLRLPVSPLGHVKIY